MDSTTAKLERGFYARVCVKLNLSQPLKPCMWIDGPHGSFYQIVEYEGFSTFCVTCGHVGHMADGCKVRQMADVRAEYGADRQSQMRPGDSTKRMQEDGKDDVTQEKAEVQTVKDALNNNLDAAHKQDVDVSNPPSGYGPWMIVDRKKKFERSGIQANNRKGDGGKNHTWAGNQLSNRHGEAGKGSWRSRKDQTKKERLVGTGDFLINKEKRMFDKAEDRGGRRPEATSHDRDIGRPEASLHDQGITSREEILPDKGDKRQEPASCHNQNSGVQYQCNGQIGLDTNFSETIPVPISDSSIIQYNDKSKPQMSSAERAVNGLGLVTTSGTRQRKRRHVTIDDGGDASPLVG